MAVTGKYRMLKLMLTSLFFAGMFVFFAFFYQYHLLFVEQLQVFMLTAGHFAAYLSKPAFLAAYSGDFLTQFYFLKFGGAVIITLTLICFWLLVRALFRKLSGGKDMTYVSLLPVAMGWIALCRPEYPLSNIISVMISVGATLIAIFSGNRVSRFLSALILVPVLYILAGNSFYIMPVTVIFCRKSRPVKIFDILSALILLAFTALFPLLFKDYYLLSTRQAFLYLSALSPIKGIFQYAPAAVVAITAIVLSLSPAQRKSEHFSALRIIIPAYALLYFIVASGLLKNTDFNLEKILRLDHEALNERWDEVNRLSKRFDLHNEFGAYYSNMALAKTGRLSQELTQHYQPIATGLFIPVNANENYLTITLSNEIWWQLGDVNAAQHSALLGTIFSPRGENSRLLRRLVEINIVNGQYRPAEKFIGILETTLFHRNWARSMRKYLDNEPECLKAGWISTKRSLLPKKDLLRKENEYVAGLRMLADNNPGNSMAVDYLLCYHLLCKDMLSFISDFDKYYKSSGSPLLPEMYQEGLLIAIVRGERKHEDYNSFAFTPATVGRMAEYTRQFGNSKGNGTMLQKDFGKTYWFYYHFAKMKVD
jgi:hypothetical protein